MSKKQIYLFCDAGMSTSIMVNKMMEIVEKHNMPLQITAFPVARAQEVVEKEKPVAILLSKILIGKNTGTICSAGDSSSSDRTRDLRHDGRGKSDEGRSKIA